MPDLVQEKKDKIVGVKPQPICKHVHISERTKTDGTPYIKGWCEKCKAWVYTEKRYCICCRKYVKHRSHYLRLKKILNIASNVYVEIAADNRFIHIPLKILALYTEKARPSDMLAEIQDSIRIVKTK